EDQEDWSKFSYIDFIEGKTFFFNENYTVEDFKTAYESFYNLSPKNSVYILNNKDEQEMAFYDYLAGILKNNLRINRESKILDINNNYFYSLAYIMDLDSENI